MPVSIEIRVGARSSNLSKAQVAEVLALIRTNFPEISFEPVFALSAGDKDKATSLRDIGKTDFFTKEIDEMLLNGSVRIAIHSAKDLPDPLPEGLSLIALTKGVDPADSLVLRHGDSLDTLKKGAVIATSSERREQECLKLKDDFTFIDLRGTIEERLLKLDRREADGVVVAEAALIRLGLTHLNRVRLPGETVPGQGRLAILAREGDSEMQQLFSCLHFKQ
ncbi:hydroxymethylbilane synthase [Estrella lausannensis]|uniref:Hydroxymethylbilane synthase n=1 Tax=Estrella lausannensis TaxID=483423 RepID=A0A0H5DQ23_9BACT|nr:hydroxymethylbilane synthase [Estrella lausannensis]CRX37619.1 porphobilinogen deaminase [Estrella lausannensis]